MVGRTRDTCRERALRLLSLREHARFELRRKLIGRGYGPAETDAAIDELASCGLQDEGRFARLYARSLFARGYGPTVVEARVRERGVDGGLAAAVVAEELNEIDLAALATREAGKRWPRLRLKSTTTATAVATLARALAGRGFPTGIALEAARRAAKGD